MKRIIILTLLLVLIPSICFAGLNKDIFKRPVKYNTYGMLFAYTNDPFLIYSLMQVKIPNYIIEFQLKTVGLVNKGEISKVHISTENSYVRIYYERHFYYFILELYALKYDCILFIFRGDI